MKVLNLLAGALFASAAQSALPVGSLADLNVYDRARQSSLPLHYSEGRHYVAGKPGNEYELRLCNRGDTDLLAVMSVDGVNVISGETAAQSQSGYVIGAHGCMEVKGWRKSMQRIAAFYFTDHGDAYATRSGRPDNVGVIGVALFKRKAEPEPETLYQEPKLEQQWPKDADHRSRAESSREGAAAPAPERRQLAAPPAASISQPLEKSLGTGHGRSERSHARQVEFERESEHPNEVITLYYDSRANLVARGVIRERPHDPQPFPSGFVPDPPRRG